MWALGAPATFSAPFCSLSSYFTLPLESRKKKKVRADAGVVGVVVANFPLEVLILQVAELPWLAVCSFVGHGSKEARGQEISAANPAVILPPYQSLRALG